MKYRTVHYLIETFLSVGFSACGVSNVLAQVSNVHYFGARIPPPRISFCFFWPGFSILLPPSSRKNPAGARAQGRPELLLKIEISLKLGSVFTWLTPANYFKYLSN